MNRQQRRAGKKQGQAAARPAAAGAQAAFADAQRHHLAGRFDQAIALYLRAIELKPDEAMVFYDLGNALREQGRLDEAIACHRRAVELKPDYLDAHGNLGNELQNQGRLDEAIACHRRVIELEPRSAQAYVNLGNALQDQGRLEDAVASYRRAIELKPDFAEAHHNLGNALQNQGWLDEAYAAFETAVVLTPRRGAFYRSLANTGRVAAASPHLRQMEALAADIASLPEAEQTELHFALGSVYGDCTDHERSFRHLLAGNRLKRRRIAYDEAATLASFNRIRMVFTAERLAALEGAGVPSRLPVFVLGMPRSGTTLVEQILASHPEMFGAGELPDLPRLAQALDPATAPLESFARLGAAYLDALRAYAPSASRIVDKLPDNFLRIGLIHLALPGARIVHVRRDPVDTCLSCFSKLFTRSLPYAYDLAELGRYYRAYEGLMAHWRQVLPPGVMLEVRYEDVVADLEGEARRILAHCDVAWDERCLAFHQTRRVVRTASVTQVRQPLYASSVGRWHAFGELARPLFDALAK